MEKEDLRDNVLMVAAVLFLALLYIYVNALIYQEESILAKLWLLVMMAMPMSILWTLAAGSLCLNAAKDLVDLYERRFKTQSQLELPF